MQIYNKKKYHTSKKLKVIIICNVNIIAEFIQKSSTNDTINRFIVQKFKIQSHNHGQQR